jgi:replication fork protection complex subunit Tof1/Swi1
VLLLFRNILAIKDTRSSISNSTEQEWRTTLQEQLLIRLEESQLFPLFLSLAGSAMDRPYQDWNLITLEIFYNIFLDRDVDDILSEKVLDAYFKEFRQLKNIQAQLSAAKKIHVDDQPIKAFKKMTTRHPRFGGTITLALGVINFFQIY